MDTNSIIPLPPLTHRPSPLQNITPSILIIIIVLAVTVIVSFALYFLLRHLNSHYLRHLAADPMLITESPSPEIPHSTINSLPLFRFSSISRRSSTVTAADCAVCLSKFQNSDLLRSLPLCCHAFHVDCIDTWLRSNLSCPLCRSNIFPSDSDLAKILRRSQSSNSFRVELGNVSRRGTNPQATTGDARSYSVGSFEYYVVEPSEVPFSQDHRRSISDQKDISITEEFPVIQESVVTAADGVAGSGHWLRDYVDRFAASISSRTASFRSSGRFFSRRIEPVEYDVEGNRIGEEISEMFSWFSGV